VLSTDKEGDEACDKAAKREIEEEIVAEKGGAQGRSQTLGRESSGS
jgi:hypothetical protein